jgi:hypothetical protein
MPHDRANAVGYYFYGLKGALMLRVAWLGAAGAARW